MLSDVSTPTDRFSDAVAGITTLLTTHHDEQTILRAVTDAYSAVLAADAIGVMGTEPGGGLGVLAASDERSRFVELLQILVGQGPCLECIEGNTIVTSSDLASDGHRWPTFAAATAEAGWPVPPSLKPGGTRREGGTGCRRCHRVSRAGHTTEGDSSPTRYRGITGSRWDHWHSSSPP